MLHLGCKKNMYQNSNKRRCFPMPYGLGTVCLNLTSDDLQQRTFTWLIQSVWLETKPVCSFYQIHEKDAKHTETGSFKPKKMCFILNVLQIQLLRFNFNWQQTHKASIESLWPKLKKVHRKRVEQKMEGVSITGAPVSDKSNGLIQSY